MRKFVLALVLSFVYTTASASTISFGQSWDGTPPGDISMITGLPNWEAGLPEFDAGTYDVNVNGGISAWFFQDEVFVSGGGPQLVKFDIVRFTTGHSWHLEADTPDLRHAPSSGPQFAFSTITTGRLWVWGLEDIQLNRSDVDYQDVYGTITRIDDVHIDPHTDPPSTVPEPASLFLLGSALVIGARKLRKA